MNNCNMKHRELRGRTEIKKGGGEGREKRRRKLPEGEIRVASWRSWHWNWVLRTHGISPFGHGEGAFQFYIKHEDTIFSSFVRIYSP